MPACDRYAVGSGSVTPGKVRGSGGLTVAGAILLISGITSGLVGEALRKDNDATWRLLVLAAAAMAAAGTLCVLAGLLLLVVGWFRRRTGLSDAELEWGLDSAEDWLGPVLPDWGQPAPEQPPAAPALPAPELSAQVPPAQPRPVSAPPAQAPPARGFPERMLPAYPSPERKPRRGPADNGLHRPGDGWHEAGQLPGGQSAADHNGPGLTSSPYLSPPGPRPPQVSPGQPSPPPKPSPPVPAQPPAAVPPPPGHPSERTAAGHPPGLDIASRPGARADPRAGLQPDPIARPRSWFEASTRLQPAPSRPPDAGTGASPQAPGVVPAGSGAASRPAPGQATAQPAGQLASRPPAAWTGQDALDDTCPLPVILPGRAGFPATGMEPAPEHRQAAADPGSQPPAARPGQDAEAMDRTASARLDQVKDPYLTAGANGEDALVRRFDEGSQRQRDLIREYFKQPGGRPSTVLRPPDNSLPPDASPAPVSPPPDGQPESATHST